MLYGPMLRLRSRWGWRRNMRKCGPPTLVMTIAAAVVLVGMLVLLAVISGHRDESERGPDESHRNSEWAAGARPRATPQDDKARLELELERARDWHRAGEGDLVSPRTDGGEP